MEYPRLDSEAVAKAVAAGPLGRLHHAAVEKLVADASHLHLSAGQLIDYPGAGGRMNLMVHGLLRASLGSTEGRKVTIRYRRTGDVLGLPWPINDDPMPVSAQAITEVDLLRTRSNALHNLGKSDARVAVWLSEELNRLVFELFEEVARNTFLPVRCRLAGHLLDLAAEAQERDVLVVHERHQSLADSVGTDREVVTRILHDFKNQGIIEIVHGENGAVRILDPTSIAALSNRP